MTPLKIFEAFSGIGTQHMALKRLGIDFEVVAISEINKNAIQCYEAIHGTIHNVGDITTVDPASIPDHDLMTYSFPCQSVSKEGLGKGLEEGSGTESSLLWAAMNIIEHKRPPFLLAENVKNLISKRYKDDFDKMLLHLDSLGYNTYHGVVNSIGYVPQNRERVFILSIRKELDNKGFRFPINRETNTKLLDLLEPVVGDDYTISPVLREKLVWTENGNPIEGESIRLRNATKQGYALAEHGDGIEFAYPTSKTRRGRVQKARSQTLTTNPTVGVLLRHGNEFRMRYLTPLEYWRLMDVDDEDFHKAKAVTSDRMLYELAGNAIVVGVLEEIFKKLFTNPNTSLPSHRATDLLRDQ